MPAEYVDVTLYEEMDEPASISIQVDGKQGGPHKLRVIRNEQDGDGWVTTWRLQLANS